MMVEWLTARIIETLTPTARKRLDITVKNDGYGKAKMSAMGGEIGMEGIDRIDISVRRGQKTTSNNRLDAEVTFTSKSTSLTWHNNALTIERELPQSIIASLKGQKATVIALHPLLDKCVISSAATNHKNVVVQLKHLPKEDYNEIPQRIDDLMPVDLIAVLADCGIDKICPITSRTLVTLSPEARAVYADRLRNQIAKGSGSFQYDDLMRWRPWPTTWIGAQVMTEKDGQIELCGWVKIGNLGYANGKALYLELNPRTQHRYRYVALFSGYTKNSRYGARFNAPEWQTLEQFGEMLDRNDREQDERQRAA